MGSLAPLAEPIIDQKCVRIAGHSIDAEQAIKVLLTKLPNNGWRLRTKRLLIEASSTNVSNVLTGKPILGAAMNPGIRAVLIASLLFSSNAFAGCVGYIGPGGPCSTGPGGGLSTGPGGGLSTGPGGGLSTGPGGGLSTGPGGGLSTGPGGGLSTGPGGGLSTGPGGGLSTGPGGGLSTGPGGGLSTGPGNKWRRVPAPKRY